MNLMRIFTSQTRPPQAVTGRQILEVSARVPAGKCEIATGAITSVFDLEVIKWMAKNAFSQIKVIGGGTRLPHPVSLKENKY
jgi:hypothetical protein